MVTRERIIKSYIEFELLNGRAPNSVFELTKKLKIEEQEFYTVFGSFEQVKKEIVTSFIDDTIALLDADPEYPSFSAREKLLALFYTLFERFRTQRSYLLMKYGDIKKAPESGKDWKKFMELLQGRVDVILAEARVSDEIKDRPYIADHYVKGYKLVFTYLFRVWIKDESLEFSTTDAAIEKAVNTSFNMLGTSPLDSLLDFGKFAFKTKVF